jgi:hypothetical protein
LRMAAIIADHVLHASDRVLALAGWAMNVVESSRRIALETE